MALKSACDLMAPLQRPLELFICASQREARHAGFGDHGVHRQDRHLRAWWPEAGSCALQGYRFIRVVVDSGYRYGINGNTTAAEVHRAFAMLRAGQQVYGADAIWLEF